VVECKAAAVLTGFGVDKEHCRVTRNARVLREGVPDHWPTTVSMKANRYQKEASVQKEMMKGVPVHYPGAYQKQKRPPETVGKWWITHKATTLGSP